METVSSPPSLVDTVLESFRQEFFSACGCQGLQYMCSPTWGSLEDMCVFWSLAQDKQCPRKDRLSFSVEMGELAGSFLIYLCFVSFAACGNKVDPVYETLRFGTSLAQKTKKGSSVSSGSSMRNSVTIHILFLIF